jgi:NAD(P)-dependent dehydrogenase (short-subunit alcohol dehydrogenase family)
MWSSPMSTRTEHSTRSRRSTRRSSAGSTSAARPPSSASSPRSSSAHGSLDILINSAGLVSGHPDFPDTPLDRVERLIGVNVTGTIAATQIAMRAMGGNGVVVNLSSTAALAPAHPDPVYAASKAAVKTFTD